MISTSFRISGLALVALLTPAGCNKVGSAVGPSTVTPSAQNPATPVARYGGKTITMKDVDEELAGEIKKMEREKTELRRRAAEQLAIRAMVQEAATKEGLSEQQWFSKHVDAEIPTPSDEAIKAVFDENRARLPPDATLESMREQIVGYLRQDQHRAQTLKVFDELKKKGEFKLLLEEPRIEVEAKGPSRGPANAKVTIVEFSDFECPFCGRAEDSVSEVMERYAGKVRLVYRHYPLPMHANAGKAAEAAACADEQGKFWEMHKQLFANQRKLSLADLKGHAQAIGLDSVKFGECIDGGKMKAKVDADQKAGSEAGVNGTPAFFINGKQLSGAQPFTEFQKVIDEELAKGT